MYSMAKCHPEKANFSKGLCAACATRKRYRNDSEYREQKKALNRDWNRTHLKDHIWYALKSRHKMTQEQYELRLNSQNGVCAACGLPPILGKKLSVDHDHKCCPQKDRSCGNCVRGLIHSECNWILGVASENPQILRGIADYAEKVKEKHG